MSQGQRAARSGGTHEAFVAGQLNAAGVDYVTQYPTGVLNAFGSQIVTDFMVRQSIEPGMDRFYIQCKNQNTQGSADQKVAWLYYEEILRLSHPTVAIVSGMESAQIYEYLLNKVGRHPRLFGVYNLETFGPGFLPVLEGNAKTAREIRNQKQQPGLFR